jgi:glycerol uptake facilitator-like aquaporin
MCLRVCACAGALLLLASVPGVLNGVERTGISFPNLGESLGRAFVLEAVLSYFLILVVLSVRSNEKRHSSLLLAFAYIACRLVAFPLTGGTLNVARSFGHAVAGGGIASWKYIWVSFLAPILGAGLATSTFLFLHHRELKLERSE